MKVPPKYLIECKIFASYDFLAMNSLKLPTKYNYTAATKTYKFALEIVSKL